MAADLGNISDTARWVAVYRAWESRRPDALFHDTLAERLAGEQGERIVKKLRNSKSMAWSLIVRTVVIDDFVRRAIAEGVDTVINLAAGLDTRPYRMELPPSLRWIEVDLPDITAYKESKLAGETPRCKLTRIVQDLSDIDGRRKLFDRLAAEAKKVLVITEGLLIYLPEPVVVGIATDLRAQPKFALWAQDFVLPEVLAYVKRTWGKTLDQAKAPMIFAKPEGPAFYAQHGWKTKEVRYSIDEARRLNREMRFMWLWRLLSRLAPAEKQRGFRKWSGYALLEPL